MRWEMVLVAAVWSWSAGCVLAAGPGAGQPGATAAPGMLDDSRGSALLRGVHMLDSRPRLFGEFGGRRGRLEDAGIMPSLYYNHFLGVQAQGGQDQGAAARHSGTGDFFLYVDLEPWARLRGSEMLLHLKAGYGRNINARIGALSDPIDDADGDSTGHIPQLWFQQTLFGEQVQLRFGYLDQQVALDRNAYANSEDRQFMATFLDNNTAIVPLAIGLGATLFLNPADWLQVTFSTADADATPFQPGFDTAFDSWTTLFGYLEVGLRPDILARAGMLPGNYRLGLIWDPRRKERFASAGEGQARVTRGDAGFYLSFDQMIYRERPGRPQGMGLFARYGYRDPEVNPVNWFWSVGGQYRGLLARRQGDVLGIGSYMYHASPDRRAAGHPDLHDEAGFEVYYRIQVFPWLQVTPDWQYIIDPGAGRSVEDALVFALRARVTF